MRVLTLIMFALSAGLMAGCSAEKAEFSHREDFDELIPEVQEHIQKNVLDKYFGTPVDMVAWERLPIHYSAAKGTLTGVDDAPADGNPEAQLTVNLTTQNRPIEPGDLVVFLSGQFLGAKESGTVEAFNPDNGLLTIQEDGYKKPGPAVGDRIVIGPGKILEEGRVLYAEHCQHCHGVSGDGAGPTAKYLNPLPRDYRLGKFKFTSTNTSDRAAREDLKTTIWEGVPGTLYAVLQTAEGRGDAVDCGVCVVAVDAGRDRVSAGAGFQDGLLQRGGRGGHRQRGRGSLGV